MKKFSEFIIENPNKNQLRRMERIYAKMKENPAVVDELWKIISTKIIDKEGNIQNRILKALQPENTKPEKDHVSTNGFLEGLVDAIDKTEGTTEERIEFANTLGSVNHIDTKALLQPISGWSDWLTSTPFSQRLFDTMFNFPPFRTDNKGPGEVALAILSPKITLSISKGDIIVDGTPIEVKAGATASGGRLSPTSGTLGQLQGNKEFWNSLFPDNPNKANELSGVNKINANNYSDFLNKYNLGPDISTKILSAIFKHSGASSLIQKAGKAGTRVTAADLVAIAIKNYGESQGDDHFLIIQKDIRTSIYFYIDNLDPILSRLSFSLPLIDSDTRSQGKAQIGILKKTREA